MPTQSLPSSSVLTLDLKAGDPLTAMMEGVGTWKPENPLADREFDSMLQSLSRMGHLSLATDNKGILKEESLIWAATLHDLARKVGERLISLLLTEKAVTVLRTAIAASRSHNPPILAVRAKAADSKKKDPSRQAAVSPLGIALLGRRVSRPRAHSQTP